MSATNTLRRSRAMFSQHHGVPADVNYYRWLEQSLGMQVVPNRRLLDWTPRGEPSNCPILATHMHRFATFTSWQLHSVARNVFVGRVPALRASALAHDTIGRPPFAIAISEGMYTAADQCVYLWEASMRLLSDAQGDLQRGLVEEDVLIKLQERITARQLEDRVEKVVNRLRHALRDGDSGQLLGLSAEDIKLPISGVPAGDLRHRSRRHYVWEQFVVAHELAHIILGHLGPTGSQSASQYAFEAIRNYRTLSTWGGLVNESQRIESDADLFGLLELSYPTSWEIRRREGVNRGWRDRSQLALLVQHLEGAAIAALMFYLLSALGVDVRHSSTHPHPDYRLGLITEAVCNRMEAIISTTNEPNEGQHSLPGFYERILNFPKRISDLYRTIVNALELASNHEP